MRRAVSDLVAVVRDDHGMAPRRHHPGIKTDIAQLGRAPFGGRLAIGLVGGVGRDALDAQQLKEAGKRLVAGRIEACQHLV